MPKGKDIIISKLPESSDGTPTIFDLVDKSMVLKAINNLISGTTPKEEIKEREVGGGKMAKYVNTYYMTHQFSLVTGFKWSSECLEERTFPDIKDKEGKPFPIQELAAKMKVTTWDRNGSQYSHVAWGCVPVQSRGVLLFDQWKAAYSDGIKKCLSYFGIANDVYGGKDLQFLGEEPPEVEEVEIEVEDKEPKPIPPDRIKFLRYLADNKITQEDAISKLGIDSIDDITNFDKALSKLKEIIGK